MLLVVLGTNPFSSAAFRRVLVDVRWDLVFARYGGLANDALGTYLRILIIHAHWLLHPKFFHVA
jgi:hypothetical protein